MMEKNSRNISIKVETFYVKAQSNPHEARYVFAYTITITNCSQQNCQLLDRHWVITNAAGEVEEVRGEGVVGKQPILKPNEKFEYTSGAVIETPVGTMQGEYGFVDAQGVRFEVEIPVFSLSVPNVVH